MFRPQADRFVQTRRVPPAQVLTVIKAKKEKEIETYQILINSESHVNISKILLFTQVIADIIIYNEKLKFTSGLRLLDPLIPSSVYR